MPLTFLPAPGAIVICDYFGHVEPEMVKKRRVVVVSPKRDIRFPHDATVIVVPLSELPPQIALAWHHPIPAGRYPGVRACWAKGDLVSHVGLARLERVLHHRRWIMPIVTAPDLHAIRICIATAAGVA